jgi:hypothetical protein
MSWLWRTVFGLLAVAGLLAAGVMTLNVEPPWPVVWFLLVALIAGLILRVVVK